MTRADMPTRGVGEAGAGGAVAPPLLKAGGPDPLEGACYAHFLLNSPPLFSTCSYPSDANPHLCYHLVLLMFFACSGSEGLLVYASKEMLVWCLYHCESLLLHLLFISCLFLCCYHFRVVSVPMVGLQLSTGRLAVNPLYRST